MNWTGKTVGENLDEIAASPTYFAERRGYLNNVKVTKNEIIRPREDRLHHLTASPEHGIRRHRRAHRAEAGDKRNEQQ